MAATDAPPAPKISSQPAVREQGYVLRPGVTGTGPAWWAPQQREMTPELQWPLSVDVFDRMRSQDAQVGSVLRAVTHPIRRTTWRIDPNGARDEVVAHVAADLGLPVKGRNDGPLPRTRDRFAWSQHLQEACLFLAFGHMPFEQVYRLDEQTKLFRLRKLGPRMPCSIAKWNVARDGGLVSIEQAGEGLGRDIVIPVSRLVVYVHEREGAEWWGRSLLRTAYKDWLIKDRMMRVLAQSNERNGMGLPAYTGPEGGKDEDLDKGLELATQVRAGDNSGLAIPAGAKFELLGVSGQIPDTLGYIKYLDEQIARGVLAHFLTLGGQTGSWALGSTFADFFTQSLQAVAETIATTASQHIVEDLVDINYGPDEPAPLVVFDEIGSKAFAIAQAIQMLVQAGVLTPDAALEAFLRGGLGLPAPDPNGA